LSNGDFTDSGNILGNFGDYFTLTSEDSYFTPLNDSDENVERTCADLLIYSGSIHPKVVSELLCIDPTRITIMGQRGPVNSLGRSVLGKVNLWSLSSEEIVQSNDLRRHIDWLCSKLQPAATALQKLQQEPGVQMYVFCPWWSKTGGGGPTLWPKQMKALSDLNLECTIPFADYS
jgi:hypothetical protein